MLLIIDNNANILKYFACESVYINAGDNTLLETLNKISNHSQVKNIYFPLEIKFKNTQRQYFEGLELLKHIRLTKDLGNLQYAPILLGYTYPLETVLRNPESTILCAPATHLFHLKNINQVNNSKLFKSEEKLTRDTLKPYILYTDTDKATTDHVRRNEHGPLKLDRELNGTSNSDIGLDLWQKQILFLQTEATNNQTQPPSKIEFKCAIKGKRILYLDDEAYKWENPLKKLFQGATLDIKSDYLEIVKYLDEIQLEQDKIRPRYTDIDKQLLKEFLSVGKTHEFELKISERYRLQNKLAGLLNYDLILLDMRLDKTADSDKPINLISGVQVLKKIQALNPFIPIVMFTASNKVDSYKSSIDNGAYEFWVKNVSSANDLKTKTNYREND